MGGKGRPRPHSSTENTFFPSPMESVSPTVPLAHDSTHTPDHVTAQPIMQGDNESAHGHQQIMIAAAVRLHLASWLAGRESDPPRDDHGRSS